MIAPHALPPQPSQPIRPRAAERARTASRRRSRRAKRRGVVQCARMATLIAALVVPIMVYVMLTANLTSLNYALARAETQKAELLEASGRLDDTIAHLESRERLAQVAAALKMHDPHVYAVVTLPERAPAAAVPGGLALLGSITEWFKLP